MSGAAAASTVRFQRLALLGVGLIGGSAALLLVAWGVFVRLNRSAEELEPEAMQQAKSEDTKVG